MCRCSGFVVFICENSCMLMLFVLICVLLMMLIWLVVICILSLLLILLVDFLMWMWVEFRMMCVLWFGLVLVIFMFMLRLVGFRLLVWVIRMVLLIRCVELLLDRCMFLLWNVFEVVFSMVVFCSFIMFCLLLFIWVVVFCICMCEFWEVLMEWVFVLLMISCVLFRRVYFLMLLFGFNISVLLLRILDMVLWGSEISVNVIVQVRECMVGCLEGVLVIVVILLVGNCGCVCQVIVVFWWCVFWCYFFEGGRVM